MSEQKRIVLTGATGTLGWNFLDVFVSRPDVRILALVRPGARQLPEWPNVETALIPDLSGPAFQTLIQRFSPTCIIHCAATGMEFPKSEWFDLIRCNVNWTVSLCECAARIEGCRFIFISTGLVYQTSTRPVAEDAPIGTQHPYGASKAAADLLIRSAAAEFGVPLTVLRPFSFTGPHDDRTRLFATILRGAAEGREVSLSDCLHVRDHCSARDVALGIVRAFDTADPEKESRIFNLGSGRCDSLRSLIEGVVEQLKLEVRLKFGSKPRSPFDPDFLVADIRRANKELGWYPQHHLAHAVWLLARQSFPSLNLREPEESISKSTHAEQN